MPSSSPTTMAFPPFSGAVRKLVFANVAVFFAIEILSWISPYMLALIGSHLMLEPLAVAHGEIWQLATYSFIDQGLLDILFAMLTLWFCGSMLEQTYGSRWLTELYFSSAIGGALVASALSFTHILHLRPDAVADGAWAGVFGLLIAIAMRFGEQEFLLFFVASIRAKYMVAIYILIAVAILLKNANAFGALLQLAGALCGWLYVRYAPRRGLAYGITEQYFAMRNAYYRARRRQAAKKFEVYMGKQGRKVRFDNNGRYIAPDDDAHRDPNGSNPNDKHWMN